MLMVDAKQVDYIYYFAIADMSVSDDGTLDDAYCEIKFPFPADCEEVRRFVSEKTGLAKERIRPITAQEYFENTDDEDEEDEEEC